MRKLFLENENEIEGEVWILRLIQLGVLDYLALFFIFFIFKNKSLT